VCTGYTIPSAAPSKPPLKPQGAEGYPLNGALSDVFRLRLRVRGSSPALLSVTHHPRSPGSPEGATTYQPRLQAGACNGQPFLARPERAGYDLQAQWSSIMVDWWECGAHSGRICVERSAPCAPKLGAGAKATTFCKRTFKRNKPLALTHNGPLQSAGLFEAPPHVVYL
jgi:hypothetical protein